MPPEQQTSDDPMLVSYRELRRAIGMIGIALPIVLVLGENQFGKPGILDSISSYYWSEAMRGVLIGSLCSIGVFLWSYRGKRWDNAAGNLACIAAVSVALFPCSQPGNPPAVTRTVHFVSAAILFTLLAYFCIISFPAQDPDTKSTKNKPVRNSIYYTCGAIILLSMAVIAILHALYNGEPPGSSVFWLESLAVWAFGWSWYIKGKGLSIIQG